MKPNQSQTLRQIDRALDFLITNRLAHFLKASQDYLAHRNSQYIGFESMGSVELYTRLQHEFNESRTGKYGGVRPQHETK